MISPVWMPPLNGRTGCLAYGYAEVRELLQF